MSSINPEGFGSLTNAIHAHVKSPEPVVGMGATELCWSDREPYTVVEVISAKKIVVQSDIATRTDKNYEAGPQIYTFAPNPEAPRIVVTLRRNGRWVRQGDSSKGSPFKLGSRDKYHDYTF